MGQQIKKEHFIAGVIYFVKIQMTIECIFQKDTLHLKISVLHILNHLIIII